MSNASKNPVLTEGLTAAIYDTIHDDSLWDVFVEAFLRSVSADRGSLILRDVQRNDMCIAYRHGWSEEDVALYIGKYAATDPWNVRSRNLPAGFIATDEDYCPRSESEASGAFREFYAPRDCYYGFGGTIISTPDLHAVITASRGNSAGRFRDRELAVLRELMPHLQRALSIHDKIQKLQMLNTALTTHVRFQPHGFCLLDGGRRLLYSNEAANRLLLAADCLRIEAARMIAVSASEDGEFERAASACTENRRETWMAIRRRADRPPFRLRLYPYSPTQSSAFAVVAVVFVDVSAEFRIEAKPMRELFGFTEREAQVAVKLALGLDAKEIAAEMRISIETVRTHLRRSMSKTGVTRQGSLIALILKCAVFRPA